jgi:thioredoxin 1
MLAPTVAAIAEEHLSAISVVKLNVDENPTTAAVYGIKGIPTMILFSEGKEVERVVGVASKDTIVRTVGKHAKLENTERQAA